MMTTTLRIPSEQDPFADRRRWTADDCRKLEALGLLEPGSYELLNGEVIEKVGRNVPHLAAVKKSFLALSLIFGTDFVQLPVSVNIDNENRPEPDVFVTRWTTQEYLIRGNPTEADMRLIVEISDTTLWRDLNTKARLYGGAGVAEYWVLDVNGRRLHIHRQPTANGYADVQEFAETDSVAPLAAPGHSLLVADLLP